jgi:hypothetical protein
MLRDFSTVFYTIPLMMVRMKYLLLGCLACSASLALTACSSTTSRFVILQHPTTKQTAECKIDPMGDMRFHKQIEDCVWAYEQAGYAVVGDSDKKK